MASPISCLSILIIPLLVTSLFYDVSNADRALIESVCKKSMDYDFCVSTLLSDPDSITTVLYRLRLISTILNLDVIEDARGEIRNLLIWFTDPLDRLEFRIAKPIYRMHTRKFFLQEILQVHNLLWKRQLYLWLHNRKLQNVIMNMRASQNMNHQYQITLPK